MARRQDRIGPILLSVAGMTLSQPPTATAQEGVSRWRTTSDGSTLHLFSAASDSTDAFGPISFTCTSGTGEIEVKVRLDKNELKAFSRILAEDVYPQIDLPGREANSSALIETVSFSEFVGWDFSFKESESNRYLDQFERTGSFRFAIRDIFRAGIDLKTGLDAITGFRRQCRKPSPPEPPRKAP